MSRSSRPAIQAFKEEVRHWAGRVGVVPRRVQVQRLVRKWGSCSRRGALTFSDELVVCPAKLRRRVIVHELLHLKVRNHGPVFRSFLRAYLGETDRLQEEADGCAIA